MNFWKKMPLVRVTLPFIIGLFCSLELGFNTGMFGILASALGGILIGLFHSKIKTTNQNSTYAIVVSITLFFIGTLRGELHENQITKHQLTTTDLEISQAYLIELEGEFSEKAKSFKSKGTIVGVYQNGQLLPHDESTLIYIPKSLISDSLRAAGQIIALSKPNQILPPKNPNEFNYKKYLNGLGINHQFYVDSAHLKIYQDYKTYRFLDTFEGFRTSNLKRLKDLGISEESFSVISALVFGQKDFLSADLYDSYGSAGATHVLAVSGLHVGLIYVILVWVCKGLIRSKVGRALSILLILGGLWSYAAITGFSPSVLRAGAMFSFITIAQYLRRGSNIYNTIATSALCLLMFMPNLLMEVGFQLSYSAVLGILIIQPFLYKLFAPNNWLLDKAWQITTVSIAAQLGTFPLGMLYFHQFPNYFMLSNLFVIPLATLILYFTLVTLLASFVPVIGLIFGTVLDYIVRFLNLAIEKMTYLPYARSEGIDISVLECFLLYAIILQLVLVFVKQSYGTLKWCTLVLVFFVALQCEETYQQHSQHSLTIHVIKGERAFSVIEGNTCYFISSETLRNDKDKIKFHVSHYLDHLGIETTVNVDLEEEYHCNAFSKTKHTLLYDKHLILLTDEFTPEEHLNAEHMVLLDKINFKNELKDGVNYYADGFTKRKYLIKRDTLNSIEELDYALILKKFDQD